MKQAWWTVISHSDNSINNHFSFTGRKQETSEHDFSARVHVMVQSVSLLGVGDKSGGQVKNVNMSSCLAGYSQLLLHDLSRDLMLISKNMESWRLSMVFLQVTVWDTRWFLHGFFHSFTYQKFDYTEMSLKKKSILFTFGAPLCWPEMKTTLHRWSLTTSCRTTVWAAGEEERSKKCYQVVSSHSLATGIQKQSCE